MKGTAKTMSDRSRDTLLFAVETVATVAFMAIVIKVVMNPNAMKTAQLRAVRFAESRCQRQAETWAHLADAAHRAYEKGKSVTV